MIYDLMNKNNEAVPSSYTYMSRSMVALCDIADKKDLWAIREKTSVYATTPKKIVSILKPSISDKDENMIVSELKTSGIIYENAIESEENFAKSITKPCQGMKIKN